MARLLLSRRKLIAGAVTCGASAASAAARGAVAQLIAESSRPQLPSGVQSGDVDGDRAVIWSRADRPARMVVEWDTSDSFRSPRRIAGPAALEPTDFTARVDLSSLPRGERVFYRVTFQDLADVRAESEPVVGSLITPPAGRRDVRFAWSGDTAGQGWGINPDWGGMRTYETMRRMEPHFFIHSGDTIYADNPLQAEVRLADGGVWKNLVTPEKAKVAESLDEFRGNHRYNLMDANVRRFNAEVPSFVQWDDHETRNNWYPGQRHTDERYAVRSVDLLAARGRRAFLEYQPLRWEARDPERIYRSYRYGPLLELFFLDQRSYRGPNSPNRQPEPGEGTAFHGPEQMRWLKERLRASRSRWKVIASDMPIGLVVRDGPANFENAANGDGPALGRELEIADLLRFIKQRGIRNVVWLTADVHYAAAHHYDPARARFTEFTPFWEFVAGPLHAGNFGPGVLDDTFGPQARFNSYPAGTRSNQPPSAGLQFFGMVEIDGKTEAMTVGLYNLAGQRLYRVELPPERG